jgi:hypothetical protein
MTAMDIKRWPWPAYRDLNNLLYPLDRLSSSVIINRVSHCDVGELMRDIRVRAPYKGARCWQAATSRVGAFYLFYFIDCTHGTSWYYK